MCFEANLLVIGTHSYDVILGWTGQLVMRIISWEGLVSYDVILCVVSTLIRGRDCFSGYCVLHAIRSGYTMQLFELK